MSCLDIKKVLTYDVCLTVSTLCTLTMQNYLCLKDLKPVFASWYIANYHCSDISMFGTSYGIDWKVVTSQIILWIFAIVLKRLIVMLSGSLQFCSLRATNGIRGCTCFTRKRDLRICHAKIFSPSNTDPDKLHAFDKCSRWAQQSRSRDGGPPQGQDEARVDGESESLIGPTLLCRAGAVEMHATGHWDKKAASAGCRHTPLYCAQWCERFCKHVVWKGTVSCSFTTTSFLLSLDTQLYLLDITSPCSLAPQHHQGLCFTTTGWWPREVVGIMRSTVVFYTTHAPGESGKLNSR